MDIQSSNVEAGRFHNLNSLSDEALVLYAKRGQDLALTELWRRHRSQTWNCIWRITGNQQDAEDTFQDACLKSFVHLKKFDGRSKFSTWWTRIAINSALMVLRKRRSHSELSLETNDGIFGERTWDFADQSEDTGTQYDHAESVKLLQAAVLRLRPSLRRVIEIQLRTGGPLVEIADAAGISVAATKSRLLRARSALRRSLSHASRGATRSSSSAQGSKSLAAGPREVDCGKRFIC